LAEANIRFGWLLPQFGNDLRWHRGHRIRDASIVELGLSGSTLAGMLLFGLLFPFLAFSDTAGFLTLLLLAFGKTPFDYDSAFAVGCAQNASKRGSKEAIAWMELAHSELIASPVSLTASLLTGKTSEATLRTFSACGSGQSGLALMALRSAITLASFDCAASAFFAASSCV
jgi:hypothetical protein